MYLLHTLPGQTFTFEFRAAYALEVDWNNDGDFGDAYEDISAYTTALDYYYGRDYASQLVGRSVAGKLRAQLLNTNGLFSSFNASSPLTGNLLPRRKVRLRSVNADTVIFAGFLEGPPKVTTEQGSLPKAELNVIGPLALLGNPNLKISVALMENVRTDQVVTAILDAAGWPVANRTIARGDVVLGRWFAEEKGALQALQEIEEAEGGFLREGVNWDIIFENRYYRYYNSSSNTSQATLSDAASAALPYRGINQDDPLRQIYNRIEVEVKSYVMDSVDSTLWSSPEVITLQAGESRTIYAKFASDIAFVRTIPYITYVATVTPSSLSGSLTTLFTPRGRSVLVTLTNTHGSSSMEVTFVIIGKAFRDSDSVIVRREDTTSQSKYDIRTYPFSSPWYPNIAYADAAASFALDMYKDPHPVLGIQFPIKPDAMWLESVFRRISHRITVTANGTQTYLGINEDFFVEGMGISLQNKQLPKFSMILSPAVVIAGAGAWWQLDVDHLGTGTETELGY